jgi:hypothetical protein
MCYIMSVNDITLPSDEISDMCGEFPNPNTITSCSSIQTSRITTIDVGVFVVAQSIDFIRFSLRDASCGIDAIDELAWKGFGVALSCGEIIVVVIEARMEAAIGGRNA